MKRRHFFGALGGTVVPWILGSRGGQTLDEWLDEDHAEDHATTADDVAPLVRRWDELDMTRPMPYRLALQCRGERVSPWTPCYAVLPGRESSVTNMQPGEALTACFGATFGVACAYPRVDGSLHHHVATPTNVKTHAFYGGWITKLEGDTLVVYIRVVEQPT